VSSNHDNDGPDNPDPEPHPAPPRAAAPTADEAANAVKVGAIRGFTQAAIVVITEHLIR
jgi:hypothetical protein